MSDVDEDGDIRFTDRDGTEVDFEDLTWSGTLNSFFRDQPGALVAHAISTYDSCLETIIPTIITSPDSNPIKIQCEYSVNPDAANTNDIGDDDDEGRERVSYRHNTEYELEFKRTQIGRPIIQENTGVRRLLVPNEARIRNITYAANLYCDITHRIRYRNENGDWGDWDSEDKNRVLICKLPLMLGSKYCQLSDQTTETRAELGECKYDNFGYFIINGQEKVLISIERVCDNRVLVFDTADTKFSDQCELRSAMDGRYQIAYTTKVRLYRTTPNNAGKTLRVLFHTLNTDIPIFVLFRALGVDSDRKIVQMIVNDMKDQDMIELLKPSLEEGLQVYSQTKALDWISRNLKVTNITTGVSEQERTEYRLRMVRSCILKYFLPHVGDALEAKAHMLGYMTNCLLQSVLGRRNYDDRDHFGNKKIDTPGSLVAFLFAQNFQKKLVKTFEKDIKVTLQGYHDSVANLKIENKIKPTVIDTGIKYSFATGVWGLKSSMASNRIGVAQQLSRINNKSALSFMRRVISQIDKTGKSVVAPRKLHMSQWGIICPSETPDGESIGIHKHLAMTAVVTDQVSSDPIRAILEDEGVVPLVSMDTSAMASATKVFLNGDWVGIHWDPPKLVSTLKDMRRNGLIHIHTAVVWRIAFSEVMVHCDSGRIVRPLYIVEDNNLKITGQQLLRLAKGEIHWQNLLGIGTNSPDDMDSAVIEYLDVNEAETAMIAMTPKDLQANSELKEVYLEYTHCEIHPAVIFGAVISEVPFAGHNQSPRVIYYGQMGKQGIGVYATSFRQRMDTVSHVLHYPQKPLVTTKTADLIGRDLPTGQNAIVAIMCYSGYNQEDSVIINEGALARGLFTTTAFKTTKEEERKNQTELQEERFMKPTENTIQNRQNINFDAIGDDGLPIPGKYVKQNDVLIGKAIEIKAAGDGVKTYRDVSHRVEVGGGGIVDDVKCNINGDGFKFVKVKIRSTRVPDIGDKVQSRHAQKGIIGMIFPQEDMPFNEDGLVPDIIINPHAMPKRMTIGQFIETIMGKVCCMKGFEGDATPFNGTRVDDICQLLGTPIEEGGCGFTESKTSDGVYGGYGNETMYNGMTGQKLSCKIFMGPTYYMRSKHMVADKYHARSTGPTQILTRQPPEGRARHGSSRLGEMERDVLIAHGMSNFLKEKFYDASDQYTVNINRKTGMFAIGNPDNGTLRDDQKDVKKVRMPYCMKLLVQELSSMGVQARFVLG